jgi:hypothetical protein
MASAALEMLKDPLSQFNTELAKHAADSKAGEYMLEACDLLVKRATQMMEDSIKSIVTGDALLFDLKEMRGIQAEMNLKTRTPKYPWSVVR